MLNPDVLHLILDQLPTEDVGRARRVCRDWKWVADYIIERRPPVAKVQKEKKKPKKEAKRAVRFLQSPLLLQTLRLIQIHFQLSKHLTRTTEISLSTSLLSPLKKQRTFVPQVEHSSLFHPPHVAITTLDGLPFIAQFVPDGAARTVHLDNPSCNLILKG